MSENSHRPQQRNYGQAQYFEASRLLKGWMLLDPKKEKGAPKKFSRFISTSKPREFQSDALSGLMLTVAIWGLFGGNIPL